MARVHADIDAVAAFRDSLARYRAELRVLLDQTTREIEIVRSGLERKSRHWELELTAKRDALNRCREASARAQSTGNYVDCTSLIRDVEEAAERLANVRRWLERVEQEFAAYSRHHAEFFDHIENGLPRAESYLDEMNKRLRAARATSMNEGST